MCMVLFVPPTAVDVEWLGVHHNDLFDDAGTCKVAPEALQSWAPSDSKVFTGLRLLMDASEKVCAPLVHANMGTPIEVLPTFLLVDTSGYSVFRGVMVAYTVNIRIVCLQR